MTGDQTNHARYVGNLRFTPLLVILLATPLVALLLYKLYGPSSVGSYELVFDGPPPSYVKTLKSEYHNHHGGYTVYIGMIVPPDKVGEIVDLSTFSPLSGKDSKPKIWTNESMFRNMDIPLFPDVEQCLISKSSKDGRSRETVVNVKSGHIFSHLDVINDKR